MLGPLAAASSPLLHGAEPAPRVIRRALRVEIPFEGFGATVAETAFAEPLPLQGVEVIALEAAVLSVGGGRPLSTIGSKLGVELLSGAQALAREPLAAELHGNGGELAVVVRAVLALDAQGTEGALATALRWRVEHFGTGDEGALPCGTITGLHAGGEVRVHAIVGRVAAEGAPHRRVLIEGVADQVLTGPGASEWADQLFREPIPAAGLRYAAPSCLSWTAHGEPSAIVESQLVLDDGSELPLDDAASPSRGVPVEGLVSTCGSLGFEPSFAAASGARVVSWRWRIQATHSLAFTAFAPGPIEWLFAYEPPIAFLRGDGDADGRLRLQDAVATLLHKFTGGFVPPCLDALDFDDDGSITVGDAVAALSHLFVGGSAPPDPGLLRCGPDPTPDGAGGEDLGCRAFPVCGR